MNKKLLLAFILGVFLISSIQAQEFGDTQQCAEVQGAGLTLSISHPVIAKIGEDVVFSIIAYDGQGKRKTSADTTCTIGLGGSQGEPRGFINESQITVIPSPIDAWTGTFGKSNFTAFSNFGFIVRCETTNTGGCFEGHFKVNKLGEDFTTPKAILYCFFIFILIFLFILCLALIPFIPSDNRNEEGILLSINNLKYLRPTLAILSYVLLMTVNFLAANVSYAYLNQDMMGDILFVFYRIMMLLLLPIFIVWMLFVFYNLFVDREIKQMIERGVEIGRNP